MMNADDVIENARRVAYNLSLDGHAWAAGSIEALLALAEEQAATIAHVRALADQARYVYAEDLYAALDEGACD